MVLVAFQNIHIWVIYGPYLIGRLVMRNPSYDTYFSFFDFCAIFGGKVGVATTRAPNDLGPSNPTEKNWYGWVDLLGQPLSRNNFFEIFRWFRPKTFGRSILSYELGAMARTSTNNLRVVLGP